VTTCDRIIVDCFSTGLARHRLMLRDSPLLVLVVPLSALVRLSEATPSFQAMVHLLAEHLVNPERLALILELLEAIPEHLLLVHLEAILEHRLPVEHLLQVILERRLLVERLLVILLLALRPVSPVNPERLVSLEHLEHLPLVKWTMATSVGSNSSLTLQR
jgi:hypothetical protein